MTTIPGIEDYLQFAEPEPERRVGAAPKLNDEIPEGDRNATLTSAGGTMQRRGMAREAIVAALLAENAARCKPPLPDREVEQIARSVSRYEPEAAKLRARRSLRVLTVPELDALPQPEWQVEGLVPEGSLVVLYGPPSSGKTFLALDLALHVATGRDWLGHEVRGGGVLYVAAEGVAGMRARVGAWRETHNPDDLSDFRLVPETVDLLSREDAAALAALCRKHETRLVVMDTLARCLPGADENAAKDVGMAIRRLDDIRGASGATCLLIHHTGKDGAVERGSSALRGAADTMLEVSADDLRLTLSTRKQKEAEPRADVYLELNPVLKAGSMSITEVRTFDFALTSRDKALVRAVSRTDLGDGVTATEWLAASDTPKRTFYDARKRLVDEGYVAKEGRGRGARYSLTEAGGRACEA